MEGSGTFVLPFGMAVASDFLVCFPSSREGGGGGDMLGLGVKEGLGLVQLFILCRYYYVVHSRMYERI